MSQRNEDKEAGEGMRLQRFVELYNKRYGSDFVIEGPENQNSIVDRRATSKDGKYQTISLQDAEVKHFIPQKQDTDARIFDLSIYEYLTQAALKKEASYGGKSAGDIILVLTVGVPENWFEDYAIPEVIKDSGFLGIYCLGLPYGYIRVLKEFPPEAA